MALKNSILNIMYIYKFSVFLYCKGLVLYDAVIH